MKRYFQILATLSFLGVAAGCSSEVKVDREESKGIHRVAFVGFGVESELKSLFGSEDQSAHRRILAASSYNELRDVLSSSLNWQIPTLVSVQADPSFKAILNQAPKEGGGLFSKTTYPFPEMIHPHAISELSSSQRAALARSLKVDAIATGLIELEKPHSKSTYAIGPMNIRNLTPTVFFSMLVYRRNGDLEAIQVNKIEGETKDTVRSTSFTIWSSKNASAEAGGSSTQRLDRALRESIAMAYFNAIDEIRKKW